MRRYLTVIMLLIAVCEAFALSASDLSGVRIKDIATIGGVRSNQLTGYGLVIGLDGSGDSKSAVFTASSIANMLQRYGITVDAATLKVKNVAAVLVTADLPPFARPGNRIDVSVSSLGDAKSLQGGTLIQTALMGANGKVYAVAQGALSIGGFSFGSQGAGVQKNHTTVGRIPDGASVEKEVPMQYVENGEITIELRRPDFTTANRVAEAVRDKYPGLNAKAIDAGTIRLNIPGEMNAVSVISDIHTLTVHTDQVARIVVNERTGVVVVGGNVKIKPVIIAQGGIKVEVRTDPVISQPAPFSPKGETVVATTSEVKATEEKATISIFGGESATIDQLVKGLQALGVTPQDLISILQALKSQGALEAELELQ